MNGLLASEGVLAWRVLTASIEVKLLTSFVAKACIGSEGLILAFIHGRINKRVLMTRFFRGHLEDGDIMERGSLCLMGLGVSGLFVKSMTR